MENIGYGFYHIDEELLLEMKKASPAVECGADTLYLGPVTLNMADGQEIAMFIPATDNFVNTPKSDADASFCIITDLGLNKAVPVPDASFVLPCAASIPDGVREFYERNKRRVARMLQESYNYHTKKEQNG